MRVAHLVSWAAAVVLAVPALVLPAVPAGAADEKSARIYHAKAERPGEDLTAAVRDAHGTLSGPRIGPWRGSDEGELAGVSDRDRERWWNLTWDSSSHVADDALARAGSQEVASGGLLHGSSFRFTAGYAAARNSSLDWEPSAPMRFASAHDANGDGLMGLFGADCGRPLAGVELSGGVGEGGLSAGDCHELGDWLSGVHPHTQATLTGSRSDGSEGALRRWWTVIGMSFASLGMKRVTLTPEEVHSHTISSGPGAFVVQMTSDAVPDASAGYLAAVETRHMGLLLGGSYSDAK